MAYFYLAIAIITETIATSTIKATEEFTKLYPSLIVIIGYGISFYFMALTMKFLPVSITYAIWSGVGITLIALIAALQYGEIPDFPAIIGMSLIIAGILVIHLYSDSGQH